MGPMATDDEVADAVRAVRHAIWQLAVTLGAHQPVTDEAKLAVLRLLTEAEHDVMRAVTAAGRHPLREG